MTETQETPTIKVENNGQHAPDTEADMDAEPAHHARRPMNAFLIFCKRHRSVVRDKYPNLENRSITKILGEWWANLEEEEKSCYTNLAKQYKDAFFSANPDFKWYKLPAPPLRTFSSRPINNGSNLSDLETSPHNEMIDSKAEQTNNNHLTKLNYNAQPSTSKHFYDESKSMFTPGKLADEAQMGGLSSLIVSNTTQETTDDPERPPQTYISQHEGRITPPSTPQSQPSYYSYSIPSPPKKRPYSTVDNDLNNKLYRHDDISPPIKEKSIAEEFQMKKLQDELYETTCLFKLSFDKVKEPIGSTPKSETNTKVHHVYNSSNNGGEKIKMITVSATSPGGGVYESTVLPSNIKNDNLTNQKLIDQVVSKEFTLKHGVNTSSDESQDKDSNMEDMNEGKHKNAWLGEYDQSLSRSSGRACKGKRYQEFMACGGLIVNKRQKKEHSEHKPLIKHEACDKLSYEVNGPNCNWKIYDNIPKEHSAFTDKDDLTYCENINVPDNDDGYQQDEDDGGQHGYYYEENHSEHNTECGESMSGKNYKASDFDLDAKIKALPSLSLEKFLVKKKENKKRKRSIATVKPDHRPRVPVNVLPPYSVDNVGKKFFQTDHSEMEYNTTPAVAFNRHSQAKSLELHQNLTKQERMNLAEERRSAIIGSKKRKPRKYSITRLELNSSIIQNDNPAACSTCISAEQPTSPVSRPVVPAMDLFGLATLAEVAAKSSKLHEAQ